MSNALRIDALRLKVKKAMENGLVVQNTIFYEDGSLLYRGWTFRNKPYGMGAVYWQNGHRYQEGLFGYGGLIQGAEYYPNGKMRFIGNYRAHKSYGPNPPVFGEYYDESGKLIFTGEFILRYGGIGHPTVVIPHKFGSIRQLEAPRINYLRLEEDRILETLISILLRLEII